MDQPRTPPPVVRDSSDLSASLCHPTPDLQSLQGAYVGNIERLEERAERMSASGSDIAEEIRKIRLEQKISDSRRSSLLSGEREDVRSLPDTRPRNMSTGSYTNSIVDVNSAARWGGYSPGGYITSPKGSMNSGSWPHTPTKRQRSTSKSSRLGMIVQSGNDRPLSDSPTDPHMDGLEHRVNNNDEPTSRHRSSSFTREYDQIAQDIENNFTFRDFAAMPHDGPGIESNPVLGLDDPFVERPGTAASGDTYHQARTLFEDFDGVHWSAGEVGERGIIPSRHREIPLPESHVFIPLPDDGMVFYPAPVPRMLNLPKRLSQQPLSGPQARRRTQLLDQAPPEARNSAMWLSSNNRKSSHGLIEETDHPSTQAPVQPPNPRRKSLDPRKSVMSLAGMPPQLRASVFFDQGSVPHELRLKNESAEDTLDSLLEASALAPVNAFTDHPIAGEVGPEIFAREVNRHSTATLLGEKPEHQRRRSSLNLLKLTRTTSGDMNKLQKRNSRMSLGAELQETPISREVSHQDVPVDQDVEGEFDNRGIDDHEEDFDRYPAEAEADDQEQQLDPEASPLPPTPQAFGPPTTLLAELQMRKQQQRNRSRTAATAFPNGMHSTLLQLDAVAEVEKKNRINNRVALAWEDLDAKVLEAANADDDEVPLGMLFPAKGGLLQKQQDRDWDRPIGLIEQRALEDNEPLSRRRNRLRGVDPNRRDPSPPKRSPIVPNHGATPMNPAMAEQGEEEVEESLAQRMRRLKNREALDQAIGDVQARHISREFSTEMLSHIGGGDEPVNEEEETLGQRRARLQREALARSRSGEDFDMMGGQARPALRQSTSLADILAAHPMKNNSRKVSEDQLVSALPAGSLLRMNETNKARHKQKLHEQNTTGYRSEKPLLNINQPTDMFNANKSAAFRGGFYNDGIGGAIVQPQQAMGMGMGMQNSFNPAAMGMGSNYYLANPSLQHNAGMGVAAPYASTYSLGQMMPMQQPQMGGMRMGMGMGMMYPPMYAPGTSGMPLQQPHMDPMLDPMLDNRQRAMIDRWRQSIAP